MSPWVAVSKFSQTEMLARKKIYKRVEVGAGRQQVANFEEKATSGQLHAIFMQFGAIVSLEKWIVCCWFLGWQKRNFHYRISVFNTFQITETVKNGRSVTHVSHSKRYHVYFLDTAMSFQMFILFRAFWGYKLALPQTERNLLCQKSTQTPLSLHNMP